MIESTIINLNNVKIEQQQNIVLDNISLTIKKGEFVYFVGKTGSGKSSILRSIYSDMSLKSGNCTVLDYNLVNIQRKKIY